MKIFVMMPFHADFAPVRETIRSALTKTNDQMIIVDELHDVGDIDDQIIEYIRQSDACIVDITLNRPNVIYEMGYAKAIGKKLIVISQELNKHIFFDTSTQKVHEYTISALHLLEQNLIGALKGRQFRGNLATPEQLHNTYGHKETFMVLGDRKVHDSTYSFFNLIKNANKRVFLAAQNHFYLYTKREEFKSEIKNFLSVSKERQIDILMCNPNKTYAVDTWNYVTGDNRYSDDLKKSALFFGSLQSWAKNNDIGGQVNVKKITFVPTSMTFVDPDEPNGFFVMVPHAYQIINGLRPLFVLSKKNSPDMFSYYWHIYVQRMTQKE